mgnify:CR=1 FL=1
MSHSHLQNDFDAERRLQAIINSTKDKSYTRYIAFFALTSTLCLIVAFLYWKFLVHSYKDRYSAKSQKSVVLTPSGQSQRNSVQNNGADTVEKISAFDASKNFEEQESLIVLNALKPVVHQVISRRSQEKTKEELLQKELQSIRTPSRDQERLKKEAFLTGQTKEQKRVAFQQSKKIAANQTKVLAYYAISSPSLSQLKKLAQLKASIQIVLPLEKMRDKDLIHFINRYSFRVIVDIPMAPTNKKIPFHQDMLTTTLSFAEMNDRLKKMIKLSPKIVGVSNRMGSGFLAEKRTTADFFKALASHKLFFLHNQNGPYRIEPFVKQYKVKLYHGRALKKGSLIKKTRHKRGDMVILPAQKKNVDALIRMAVH